MWIKALLLSDRFILEQLEKGTTALPFSSTKYSEFTSLLHGCSALLIAISVNFDCCLSCTYIEVIYAFKTN